MELELSLRQKLIMTQKMQLAVKILQMNSLDLDAYLQDEALENPLLELDMPQEIEDLDLTRFKKLEWLDRMDESNSFKYMLRPEEEREMPLYEKRAGETLEEALRLQLTGLKLPVEVERTARYLINSLDENGYLATPREHILKELGCGEELLREALEALYRMDPPGVGATGLQDCLLIQARRMETPDPILIQLIENHLDFLAKNRLDKLAAVMNVSIEQVKRARDKLLTLNPKPGNGFSERGAVPYIRPELFVVRFENSFQVIYNDFNQPKIEISGYYRELAKNADAQASAYIRDKLADAENLIHSINQRKSTILDCARAILERQTGFFKNGPGHLAPMTLADVAGDLGVHISTVSRAVSGKYLQSQWGVQRLGGFFTRGVSKASEQKSQDMTLVQIRRIIDEEDSAAPLSDRKIADMLELAGIHISRRTVAKYRDQARIPPAAGRKRF